MNGKSFTVARRYGENASVKDESGNLSSFTPFDLLPEIEMLGQNEIYEIAQDKSSLRQLLTRFLETGQQESEALIKESLVKLEESRKKLIEAQAAVAAIEDEVALLPELEEQAGQFQQLGLEDKLKVIPFLEMEKRMQKRVVEEECLNLDAAFREVRDSLPDTVFLSETAIAQLPHVENLRKMREALDKLYKDADALLSQWQIKYNAAKTAIAAISQTLDEGMQQEELALEKTFKELPSSEEKSGKEIGLEFQRLLKEIERIRLQKVMIENRAMVVSELSKQRKAVLVDLSATRAERSARFERSLKSLNKKLSGKLKLTIQPEADRIAFAVVAEPRSIAYRLAGR